MTFRDKQEPNCTRRQNKTRLDGDSELFELPRRSSRLNGHVECDNGAWALDIDIESVMRATSLSEVAGAARERRSRPLRRPTHGVV